MGDHYLDKGGAMSSFLFLSSYLVILMLVVAQDDRCLLESGGSTLRFFAAEDLSVGGVVGKIGVQGNLETTKFVQKRQHSTAGA